jgi:hypothetical protein
MTEEEWLTCEDPKEMLGFLIRQTGERKMHLFLLACARDLVAYRPDAAAEDGWESSERFQAAYESVIRIWWQHSYENPLAAITYFRVNPAHCLRDIFGPLPFRPVAVAHIWRTPAVLALAEAAYENHLLPSGHLEPDRLLVLADALEEAGCDNADVLNHLRQPGEHVRGCWPVDLLLNKE